MWWWPTDDVPTGQVVVVNGAEPADAWGRCYPAEGDVVRRAAAEFLATARAVRTVVGDARQVEVLGGGMLATLVREQVGPAATGAVVTAVDTTGDAGPIQSAVAALPRLGRLVLAAPPRAAEIPLATYRDIHVRALSIVGLPWVTVLDLDAEEEIDRLLRAQPLAIEPGDGWYLLHGRHR